MIFLDIQRDVWTRLNKPNPPDPQTQARIKSFINQRHRTLLTMPGLDQLRHATTTIIAEVGEAKAFTAPVMSRINAITDPTNQRRLIERPLTWLRSVDPRQSGGTPTVYVPLGYEACPRQPVAPSALWTIGQHPDETGVIRVEGLRETTTGQPFVYTASAQMIGGVGYVQLGTKTDWIYVTKLFVSQPAHEPIALYAKDTPGVPDASTPGLGGIPPGQMRSYWFTFLLWPTPAQRMFYTVDYTREIEDLIEDTDEPLLPKDFHDLLSIGARQDEYEKVQDDRFKTAVAEWNERYKALQYFLQGRASTRIIPHGMRGTTGMNNVNPWAPADFFV